MTTPPSALSPSTAAALRHLKAIKPHDGWAVQSGPRGVKLLRRSVPVSDTWFLELAVTPQQKCVAGVIRSLGTTQTALILVESNGIPVRYPRTVLIQTTTTTTTTTRADDLGDAATTRLTDEENKQILLYAIYAVLATMVAKVFVSAAFMLYLLAFPVAYWYALSTCPRMESFDAKQQLKRVLRGHDLPEDHPDKPKGFINQALRKVQASVTAELAMSTGYEVSMMNMIGACVIATVRVPSMDVDCYWIGALNKWTFLGQREIPKQKYE